jgi:hypothetical protein
MRRSILEFMWGMANNGMINKSDIAKGNTSTLEFLNFIVG